MSSPTTPYSAALAGRDPVASIREVLGRISELSADWTAESFERSYAPGKWTGRIILLHLTHSELALGTRVRLALTTNLYVAQPFDQDAWVALEAGASGPEVLRAFTALAGMNLSLYASLSETDRERALSHPEYGPITVNWIIHQQAGHQRHHLGQLEGLAGR